MNNNQIINSKNYLFEFDQINNQMTNKMLSNRITSDITSYFINCMIPHQQAAIYLCQNLLKYSSYEPLRNVAFNIIKMHTRVIEQMQQILNSPSTINNSNEDVSFYSNSFLNITMQMIAKMTGSQRTYNIDLNFIGEMIPHHQGAIDMCNNLIKYKIDPNLYNLAISIINEQTQGITQLKEIGRNMYHI